MISDLINSEPQKLEELDFGGVGGSAEQGSQIMEAIYDSEMQVKKLDISANPQWTESESYTQILFGILSKQDNLSSISIGQNKMQMDEFRTML